MRRRHALRRISASPLLGVEERGLDLLDVAGRGGRCASRSGAARAGPGAGCRRRAGRPGRAASLACMLDGAGQQCGGRAGVLEAPVPRTAGMNIHCVQSSTWLMPLAASAMTSMRSSGDGSSPATSGTRSRVQHGRRAGFVEAAGDEAPVERGVVGDGLGPECGKRAARPLRAGLGGGSGSPTPARRARAPRWRRRHALSAHQSVAAAPRRSATASICSTLRPGRSVRVAIRCGASGTGRRMS